MRLHRQNILYIRASVAINANNSINTFTSAINYTVVTQGVFDFGISSSFLSRSRTAACAPLPGENLIYRSTTTYWTYATRSAINFTGANFATWKLRKKWKLNGRADDSEQFCISTNFRRSRSISTSIMKFELFCTCLTKGVVNHFFKYVDNEFNRHWKNILISNDFYQIYIRFSSWICLHLFIVITHF